MTKDYKVRGYTNWKFHGGKLKMFRGKLDLATKPNKPDNHDRLGWPDDPNGSDRPDDTNGSSRPDDPNGLGGPEDPNGSDGPDDPDGLDRFNDPDGQRAQRPRRTRLVKPDNPQPRRVNRFNGPSKTGEPDDPHGFGEPNVLEVSGGPDDPNVSGRPNDLTDSLIRQA
ncbi:hypothetical protein DEO72_LG8g950 [Vigna unguiculata]|uniref:Uncharacterized protein n=1 Tax=Vigna unguiculata TaxID=3917 RepID=A0A4D6MNJ2_VIGUN|nr:hypothetical protein DEO72_LG8g950 [Vigna unguiculata]